MCGENCVGLEWKKALIGVKYCTPNELRSAINVSKSDHNVTGALLGCRFRVREVGDSNPLAPTNQFKHLRLSSSVAVFVLWRRPHKPSTLIRESEDFCHSSFSYFFKIYFWQNGEQRTLQEVSEV